MMKLIPLHDRVVLRRLEEPQKGLIVIPDVAKEKSTRCEVIAVGPGAWRDGCFCKTAAKPGDIVLIGPYVDLEIDGEKLAVCQEADIRCIIG